MILLKQSTAVTLKIGPFLDDTDGKTAETGLTIAQADVRLSKNGGDIAQKNEATSCTHDELGIYGCPIDATDTGTLGRLQLWVHESGALPVWHEFMVVPANVYDSLFSTDKLQVDVTQCGGSTVAAGAIPNAAADAAGGLPVSDAGGLDLDTKLANTNEVTAARMQELDAANIPADVDTLKTYCDKIDDAGDGLTAIKAEVEGLGGAAMRGTDSAALASVCTEARLAELAAANLPADIDNILLDTNELQGLISASKIAAQVKGMDADVVTASALADDAGNEIADQVADEVYEGTLTLRQIVRIVLAVLAGKSAGGGTATITFRDNADGKDRVSATVESDGDRTAVTLDGT